jgi:hypothetical protein
VLLIQIKGHVRAPVTVNPYRLSAFRPFPVDGWTDGVRDEARLQRINESTESGDAIQRR